DTEYYYTYTDDGMLVNYFYYDNYLDSVTRILFNNGYSLYVGVSDDMENGSGVFASQYQAFESRKENAPKMVVAAVVCALIVIGGIAYLAFVSGKTSRYSEVTLVATDYVFNDVWTLLFIVMTVISYVIADRLVQSIYYVSVEWVAIIKGLI